MRLVESDPDMRKRRAQIHAATEIMVARGTAFKRVAAKKVPVAIPVVVHVVYKTAAENIPLAQIQTQIDALNRDYSAVNPDKSNKIGRDTSELQSPDHLVCRLLLEKKKT